MAEPGDDITDTPKADRLIGTSVGEHVIGFAGDDVIKSRGGNDVILAGFGNDTVLGGKGNDQISGWGGNDKLTGGNGVDTFVFHKKDGYDTITDFTAGGNSHDIIDLRDFTSIDSYKELKSMLSQHGKDVVISLPTDTQITLHHVSLGDLTRDDFIF